MHKDLLEHRVQDHLRAVYGEREDLALWVERIVGLAVNARIPPSRRNAWDESTALVIAYGDSVSEPGKTPLAAMADFFAEHLAPEFTSLHLLPYYPSTSDDGFSVVDYTAIDPALGDWDDVNRLGRELQLMADLVLNHCSQESAAFQGYLLGEPAYEQFFFEPAADFDLSNVVRPRPQPVRQVFEVDGEGREVWCTFSRDQVDLNYANPNVLLAMLKVVVNYLEQGAQILRLDAVAFLWKRSGSACVNEPETHEIIRLIRTLVDFAAPQCVLVTETNLPNQENLSYFGNGNEAHWVYNFPLPPLATYALLHANGDPLRRWAMSLPPALPGMTYLNFLASHDGMGLRPTEGLLTPGQSQVFTDRLLNNGAKISYRARPDGSQSPYEANITLYSALEKTVDDLDGEFALDRFLAAHAIMFALEGVPAVYFNSLLAQPNDTDAVEESGIPRRINRTKYMREHLDTALGVPGSRAQLAFDGIKKLLDTRRQQPAFHPNATQFTLQLPEVFFGLWRQSLDRRSNLFAVTNLSAEDQTLPLSSLNLVTGEVWVDLLDGSDVEESQLTLSFAPYQTRWVRRFKL